MNNFKSNHPLQSKEWAEFRKKTGIKVVEKNGMRITIHKIPHTPYTIGYFPKGPMPTTEMIKDLKEIGKKEKCIFIQLEPDVEKSQLLNCSIAQLPLSPAAHPLFTKYTFVIDLTKSEEELLKSMHPKTRYNIKVAKKHNVQIVEDNSDDAFEQYLRLTKETTKRQRFYAHTEQYHRLMWNTLKDKIAHLFLAKCNEKTLVAWILFVYKDTLYYPYGASSNEHRETMASNLLMWEAIRFGKKLGLKRFDMWGALGANPNPKDPWFGFHKFKQGYGPKHTEFIGSYDLVISPMLYNFYKIADKLRWLILKIKSRIS